MTKWSNNKDANNNQLLNLILQILAADPGAPSAGRIWFNSAASNGVLRYRNQAGTTITLGPLDVITPPSGDVSLNSQKITNLADPVAGSDAANRTFVEMLVTGIKGVKDPVRVAVGTNVNIASPGATQDGVTISAGDTNKRVLLRGQTTTTENGIYDWNGAATPMTRSSDANATGEIVDGTAVSVAEGTSAGLLYLQQNAATGAPGTWTQNWTSMGGGTSYSAGTGITLTGTTFSLTAPVTIALGGTGQTTAAAALKALGGVAMASGLIGDGSATSIAFTHNLNTKKIVVGLREVATDAAWEADWVYTNANTITFAFSVAPTSGQFEATVMGVLV